MPRKAFKPNKSIAKRFRVTRKGKLKRRSGFTSHLMSNRSGNKRRKLRHPHVVPESHARRLRKFMGVHARSPGKTATKLLAAQKREAEKLAAKAAGAKA